MKKYFTLSIGVLFSMTSWGQGCWDSISQPYLNFVGDTVNLCPNESFEVAVLNYSNYDSFLWSTGSITSTTTISDSGDYWYTVTLDTCSITDTFHVNIHPESNPYIVANGPTEFCAGETVQLCVEPGPWASALWSSGNTTDCILVTQSYDYCVTVLDVYGCIDSVLAPDCITAIVHDPNPTITYQGGVLYCQTGFATYQWYLNGVPIPGANDYYYNYSGFSGEYNVLVTDTFGCSASHYPLAIQEVTSIIGRFDLYPNPAIEKTTLELQLKEPSQVNITIKDILGRNLKSTSLSSSINFREDIDLSGFEKGIYFFQLEIGEETIVQRLVKE